MPAGKGGNGSRQAIETSNAVDLEPGVFSPDDPREMAASLERPDEHSARLEQAQGGLRALQGRPRAQKGGK
jgi:hypothetical protein